MSHPMIKSACVVAGFAVAALAATSAHAAKPLSGKSEREKAPLSIQQKNQMAEAMARLYKQREAAAGQRTRQTLITEPTHGGTEVPEDLHNHLSVQRNADGTLRIIESDGPTAPVLNAPEASNEK